ncbi:MULTISPECIES: AI-2E family transporter [unclassified Roseitalea]|uniref:AI-2E family transporter n=1 Tax=unclassified Roseitalea TaxID=2639107 RepID=UPI00273E8503|nr:MULTISPECIES: AI-2E family transporter [unclassified Roseitalea]
MITQRHDRFRNFVYGLALALMIGWILYIGQAVIIPVIASVILAYIVTAIAQYMQRIPVIGPLTPSSVRFSISIAMIILIVAAIVWLIISNINQLIALAPTYQERLLSIIQGIWRSFGEEFGIATEPTWETIRRDIFGEVSLQSLIGSTVTSVSVLVGTMFVIFVYTGFALAERQVFERKSKRLTESPDDSRRILEIVSVINTRIGDYLATKTLINLVLGLMCYIVMAAIDLDFAAFWGVLIALMNYVPYVGSFLGVLFPTAIAIVQFGDVPWVLGTFLALTACQVFVGSLLEPSLMGRSLNLSPFIILVSLTGWGALWGIAGALLSVPLMAIMVIILSEFDGTRPIAVLLSRNGRIPPKRHNRDIEDRVEGKPGTPADNLILPDRDAAE